MKVKSSLLKKLLVLVMTMLLSAGFVQAVSADDGIASAGGIADDIVLAEDVLEDSAALSLYEDSIMSLADVMYMSDVTSEMTNGSYWAKKVSDPDKVLADADEIATINEAILKEKDTNMHDLAGWDEDHFNGVKLVENLLKSAEDDALWLYNSGVWYDQDGNKYSSYEEAREKMYDDLIALCADPDATEDMEVKYAICTTRSCLLTFPTDLRLLDDPSDYDFDYRFQTGVRVNEPLIIRTKSADGKYYMAISSCSSGWIPVQDVAICQNKEEWLKAWNIAPEEVLVVCDDRIYTEESYASPETSQIMLSMGTCLRQAKPKEIPKSVGGRSSYNNYVVWMPTRNADGSYKASLALIGENRKVSEGYLPLTAANVLDVAMNQLGDTYGWGGMLSSEDCSGYVRDVYKCFGLELARNTNWQQVQPVKNYDLQGMSDDEKKEIIRNLPPGAVLIFRGHEMLYLGYEESENGEKFYVISSVYSLLVNGVRTTVKSSVINTLDVQRANLNTWLTELNTAQVPYFTPEHLYPEPEDGSCEEPLPEGMFPDVTDPSKPYYNPVYWASSREIIFGCSDGYFHPADSCTRAQFVTMLWRLAGRPEASSTVEFTDVNSGTSAYRAIQWAVEQGIIIGYEDGTFRPSNPVTRRQVAVMLWRWQGRPAATMEVPFTDISKADSAYRAVQWGAESKVIRGSKDSEGNLYFLPSDYCKRQQIVTFLYRYARDIMGMS